MATLLTSQDVKTQLQNDRAADALAKAYVRWDKLTPIFCLGFLYAVSVSSIMQVCMCTLSATSLS